MLRRIAAGLIVMALLLALGGAVGAAWVTREAQWVQRIEPSSDEETSLFGGADEATRIGSPQLVIIRDRAAFLPGEGPDGSRLVSEQYLREQKIYPLQAKTVRFVRDMILLSALGLFGTAGTLWLWSRRTAAHRTHTR